MSWVTVFFSLPSFHRFPAGTRALKFLYILQSYLIFTFALVILFTAKKFGSLPECNPIAVMVLFQPFSALKAGQIIGLVAVGAVTAVYTAITALDFLPPSSKLVKQWVVRRRIKKDQEPISTPENDVRSNGTLQEASIPHRVLQQPVS